MKQALAAAAAALCALALPAMAAAAAVDERVLALAIDRELEGVPRDGKLDITFEPRGSATLTYIRGDGVVLRRTVSLPERDDDAVALLAMLAGNLVRDQAGDVLADLDLRLHAGAKPPRQEWITFGLVPPLSSDLFYGEGVVSHIGLHLLMGDSLGVRGASVSGVIDVQRRVAQGVQLAGVSSVALTDVEGLQLSGLANVTTGHVAGAQLSGFVNVARSVDGAQVSGFLGFAGRVSGAQVSTFNVAGKVRGAQIGVFNYADDVDGASIGAISIVRKGTTELDTWGESTGTAHLTLRHGSRRFQNVYGLGVSALGDGVEMFGAGFSGRLLTGPVDLDLALINWSFFGALIDTELALLEQARLTVAVPLGRRLAVFGGAALNVFVADSFEDGAALHPVLDQTWTDGDLTVRMWPSFFAGLRVR